MDRKRAKVGNSQASRSKWLRFHGNQYTVDEDVDSPRTSGEKLQSKGNLDIIISSIINIIIIISISIIFICIRWFVEKLFRSVWVKCMGIAGIVGMHSGLKTVEIVIFFAVNIFNEGFSSILCIFNTLGIIIRQQMKVYAKLSRWKSRPAFRALVVWNRKESQNY